MMIDSLCTIYVLRIQAEHKLEKHNNCLYRYTLTLMPTCQFSVQNVLTAYKLPDLYAVKLTFMHKTQVIYMQKERPAGETRQANHLSFKGRILVNTSFAMVPIRIPVGIDPNNRYGRIAAIPA